MKRKFNDNIKVLVYGDFSKLEGMMDHHFLGQLTAVSDEITQSPTNLDELNKHISERKFTHVMVPDEWFHRLDGTLKGCKVPVVELLLDHWIPWAIEKKKNYLQENDIKHTIVFSKRFQEPYRGVSNFHTVLCGYDPNTFVDLEGERDIDILINGSLGEDTHKWVYPVRNWLAKVLPEIGEKEGINVQHWKHPGYWPKEEEKPKQNFTGLYAEILNRSKIAIGGSSHWQLTLKKFYEIPACGTILLSDLPLEDFDFFNERIIEVDRERINSRGYKDEIKRNIMNILENYKIEKERLQPFRTEQDIFDRSYKGRALEMRAILSKI